MTCAHLMEVGGTDPQPQITEGCQECLPAGHKDWVHLRLCMDCGHVACCDSSPRKHATAHFHDSGHPVVRSFEPGEKWLWCYVDEAVKSH